MPVFDNKPLYVGHRLWTLRPTETDVQADVDATAPATAGVTKQQPEPRAAIESAAKPTRHLQTVPAPEPQAPAKRAAKESRRTNATASADAKPNPRPPASAPLPSPPPPDDLVRPPAHPSGRHWLGDVGGKVPRLLTDSRWVARALPVPRPAVERPAE
ncbi:hypothetical protein [Streptomyces sp. NPDC000994]